MQSSTFQTILLIVFGVAFVAAVLIFSGLVPIGAIKKDTSLQGNVMVWGVLPRDKVQPYLDAQAFGLDYSVQYQYVPEDMLVSQLIVALANGTQPDAVIYPSELYYQIKDKLYKIPYTAYPERLYRDTYIDGAKLLLTDEGAAGFPMLVDPLVVYYNKDILVSKNFVVPPTTWSGLQKTIALFTKRTQQNTITQSTIPLGESVNISHMRDIMSVLFLQTGNQIVAYNPATGAASAELLQGGSVNEDAPSVQALRYYVSFSNPTNGNYSWNKSLPESMQMFLAGKSAFYIGRASELFSIQAQNPNLNFDVMEMFQTDEAPRPITYGSFLTLGLLKAAPNMPAAYAAAVNVLTTPAAIDSFSKAMALPPVRRDLLLVQQQNPYVEVFFKAALSSFPWLDPNPRITEGAFRDMVTAVASGRLDPQAAILEATRTLQSALLNPTTL